MSNSKLMTTVAVIALTAGSAFAGSTEYKETDAELKVEEIAENVEQEIEETASDAAAATEDAAEQTADAAGDAAQAVEETAENAAVATADMAEDAGQAIEETAENAADATEEAADETVETAADVVDATEEGAEAAGEEIAEETNELATEDMVTSNAVGSDFEGMVVGDLIGLNVYGTNDETVGEIDYIVRDNDKLAAVIGIGGFLGLGEYTVAIPLEQFSMASGDMDGLKLSSWTEEELEQQPEFDESGDVGLDDDVRLDEVF